MRSKPATLGAVVLYLLSIGLGLIWWLVIWKKAALMRIPSPGFEILIGLGVFQVLGWVVIFVLLLQSLRGSAHGTDGVALGLCAGILLGNLVWYFTPILGAPLIILITVAGLVRLYLLRKG